MTALLLGIGFCGAGASVQAIDEISTEEHIAEMLVKKPKPSSDDKAESRPWAVLPQLGYGPDSGPVVGAKFTHRDVFGSGILFDFDGTYAVFNQQESVSVTVAHPHLADDHFLVMLKVKGRYDPQREFFGLGNNDVGPKPLSTHAYQEMSASLTGGWRPIPQVALNLSLTGRYVEIRDGDRRKKSCHGVKPCPFTDELFPDLSGVEDGWVNPLSLSVVWNGRDDIVRPTRGPLVIGKIAHTNKSFGSDFEFTKLIADAGYLYPLFDGRVVCGLRGDAAWIEAPSDAEPFWDLVELGGSDTLRGFFPHRFAGKGRALLNAEIRTLLVEFDFFTLWHVKIDGVLAGEGGEVFLKEHRARKDFNLPADVSDSIESEVRYSYGGGLRIALAEALVARLDAGFSDEETGLFYLEFGHTF